MQIIHWWVNWQLDPTNPADHPAQSLRHSRWRAAEVTGQVSVPCNIELRTLELTRRPPQVERHRLECEQRKVSSKLTLGTFASSSGCSHTATTSTEHVTQVAETINRFEHTVTNLNLLERAAFDRAYTRLTMAMRTFIGQVLEECFEARTFLIMNPQVASGAQDGWPTYSHTAHSTWELAGILQDIQPEPRSHELCFSHVYMKTLGSNPSFHALTRSTHSSREVAMIMRSSAKHSSQGTPTLKFLDKTSSTMIKVEGWEQSPDGPQHQLQVPHCTPSQLSLSCVLCCT